jgi:hypothetical protein
VARKQTPILERIERLSIPEPNSGCWLWLGSLNDDGYGSIIVPVNNGSWKRRGAHRISWIAHNGEIPDGLSVLHHCDNRPCINPDHLFLGTQTDNVQDMHAKGRWQATYQHGEDSHLCKLTEQNVRRILASTDKSSRELAREFSISQRQITEIRAGRSWKYLHSTPATPD